ncbi:phage integrase family protein [Chitinophaga sp. XS-30]|nr:phage integrase family protein [Chitinophaga sp. XS-30]
MSAFFDTLVGLDAIEYNPCDKIDDKPPIAFGIHRHATDEETEVIKNHLAKAHPELLNLLRVEYVTGMRPDEILQVKYTMVDWLNSVIKLSYEVGKTKVFRLVPVPAFLLDWIRERQGDQPATNYLFGRKLQSGPRSLTTNNFSRLWNKYVKAQLGLDVSLYSFKGAGGDAKRDVGIDRPAVSVGWGHTSVNTSKIYLEKEGERMRKQIIANSPDF